MTTPLTTAQIKRAGELIEKLERIEVELQEIFRSDDAPTRSLSSERESSPRKRRKMSAAARARIAAAQRERWAKTKNGASKPQSNGKKKKKRVMSPESRAKIAAAQKRRWAKQRKAK